MSTDTRASTDARNDYIDDPAFDSSRGEIIAHYRDCRRVYDELATVDDHATTGFLGNHNWYLYDGDHRRGKTFESDFGVILDDASPSDRSMYVVTSWKDSDAVYKGATRRYGEFKSGEGLADYDDIRACPVWIDCDLKQKRRRGSFTDEELAEIEADIESVIEIVAEMYALPPEDIAAFDSGGGFYPWGPAAATLPIVEAFSDESDELLTNDTDHETVIGLVFDELTDRIGEYLDGRIESDWIDADAGTNKNRQSKAPLSIHGDHEIVVTPVRDIYDEVDYSPTLVSDVDHDVLTRTVVESRKITAVDEKTRAAVGPLVETLWPEYSGEWDDRLATWLLDERERELEAIHQKALEGKRRRDREQNRSNNDPGSQTPGVTSGMSPSIRDVYSALDDLATERVAEKTIVDEWTDKAPGLDDNSSSDARAFVPTWGGSDCSGTANIVTNRGWNDTGGGGYGGPVVMALIDLGSMSPGTASPKRAKGQTWARGVDHLRGLGFDVPRWVPGKGSAYSDGTYDQTPEWAIRDVAYANGHDPADDVCRDVTTGRVIAESKDRAEQYTEDTGLDTQRSVRACVFNVVLELLEEAGIDHGRTDRSPARDMIR